MGTPDFAATILEALLTFEGGEVVGVYTQPDRPAGRGKKVRFSAVKNLAMARRLPVYQPVNFKKPIAITELSTLRPDVCVVAAYGLILPQAVLDVPRYGCLNAHASLLPKYRGAAPIQRAIIDGEPVTGMTIMQMNAGMDTGDILLQRALGIGIDDTAATIHDELAKMGGQLMLETLSKLESGGLTAIPQEESKATYAAKLTKADGEIDWRQPALDVHNRIRGVHPWPGAFFMWGGLDPENPLRLTVQPGKVGPLNEDHVEPGTIVGMVDGHLAVACADRLYLTPNLCPEGRCLMDARAFCNGYLNRCPAPNP
ncbi:methionyl-tRNA formyltransferase [Oceanidesulfovibrio marinus]|uniref:Methionyl-tRNA formyltransferase n=2 Tax=Oceanidesulfovibrio marinus TaxID=370038 RepID=A0A6P1ZLD5_9BACT|nr:methionyl-tRNA formyltransferase [Oceanidesulfovibrio marinus]TVM36120.1 methionyl-tRNA formyltransferase [Oceanidesulfovibrio marinus]